MLKISNQLEYALQIRKIKCYSTSQGHGLCVHIPILVLLRVKGGLGWEGQWFSVTVVFRGSWTNGDMGELFVYVCSRYPCVACVELDVMLLCFCML